MRAIWLGLICLLLPALAQATPAMDAALCKAVVKGNAAAITGLIKKGANKEVICASWQATPLENAVQADNLDAAAALLAAGAKVDAFSGGSDCCWKTALGFAHSVAAEQLLIAHHADVNIKNKGGTTPLLDVSMGATMDDTDAAGDEDMKRALALIEAGADVNLADTDGIGPLAMAIGDHSKALVQLLIDHGADVNAKNSFGVTPLSVLLAKERDAPAMGGDMPALKAMEDLLRSHGATL